MMLSLYNSKFQIEHKKVMLNFSAAMNHMQGDDDSIILSENQFLCKGTEEDGHV